MGNFSRSLDNEIITTLKQAPLFTDKLYPDIVSGQVFPAIRNNSIDFYYSGSNLFKYRNMKFSTNFLYVITPEDGKTSYVTETDLVNFRPISDFSQIYEKAKRNISRYYSKPEANMVSKLYKFSPYSNNSTICYLLDIEVAFENNHDEEGYEKNEKKDRIDVLLFNNETKTLLFCEAKTADNSELCEYVTADCARELMNLSHPVNRIEPLC